MAAQKGIDMLIYLSDDGTSGGTFNLIGGMRTTSFRFSSGTIDVTSAEHQDRWQRLITGGIRMFGLTGGGVFNDDTAFGDMVDTYMAAATETLGFFRFIIPSFRQIEAQFHISELEWSGDHDGEVSFSITANSAGAPTITAI